MLPNENALIGPRTPVAAQRQGRRVSEHAGRMPASMGVQGGKATLFSFLYSTSPRSSVTLGGTVLASSLADARAAAGQAIKEKFPDGVLKVIEVARNSRFPVKYQDGWIAPSLLEGGLGGTPR